VGGDKGTKTGKKTSPLRTSQGTWARSNVEKAHAFAEHLAEVFQLLPSKNVSEEEEVLIHLLQTLNHRPTTPKILGQEVISSLNPKISLGYVLISGKILKKLPIIGIKYLTQLFNAVLLKGYFLAQWKVV
jgi:hypothetical protein